MHYFHLETVPDFRSDYKRETSARCYDNATILHLLEDNSNISRSIYLTTDSLVDGLIDRIQTSVRSFYPQDTGTYLTSRGKGAQTVKPLVAYRGCAYIFYGSKSRIPNAHPKQITRI